MNSTTFPQINHTYKAMTADEVPIPYNELGVCIGEDSEGHPSTVSCWEPVSDSEMFNFLINRKVWLNVAAPGMPPVSLSLFNPFQTPESLLELNCALNDVSGAFEILQERFRVIGKGVGFQPSDDAGYDEFELMDCAMAYLTGNSNYWPFGKENQFKPTDEISNLIKAGQFIAARIDAIRYQNEQTLKSIAPDESTDQGN